MQPLGEPLLDWVGGDEGEEQAYFPETKDKNSFSEDIRKFLIEHELGRRIARMFLHNLKTWKEGGEKGSMEPLARFLKSYSIFITDHTGKEDKFFDIIEEKSSLSNQENEILIKHFENCRNQVGGIVRIERMMKLIEYLEDREWMKKWYFNKQYLTNHNMPILKTSLKKGDLQESANL